MKTILRHLAVCLLLHTQLLAVPTPTVECSDKTVYEDGSVTLTTTVVTNAPPGIVTTITIHGIPPTWIVIPNGGAYNPGTGTWTYTLPPGVSTFTGGPTVSPPRNSDRDLPNLQVTAVNRDPANGLTSNHSVAIDVIVDAVADVPNLTVVGSDGFPGNQLPLTIQTSLTDTDFSETITKIVVRNLPTGASLNQGTNIATGTYQLFPGQLDDLKVNTPLGAAQGTSQLTIESYSVETNKSDADFDTANDIAMQSTTAAITVISSLPFTYTSNGSAITITGYTGPGGAVVIPGSIAGLPVAVIGSSAFSNKSTITSVTIPLSVTNIGSYAFSHCSGLTSATIPSSVTSMGGSVFYSCSSLTTISVDIANISFSSADGVLFNKDQTSLLEYPAGKSGNYLIPSSVATIGSWAFAECDALTSVTIPSSVTSVGDYAFAYSGVLTNLTIQYGVVSIGSWAFAECDVLPSVTLPSSLTSIGNGAFFRCTSLTSVSLPEGLTSIGQSAFFRCSGLTDLTIPSSVTSIEASAFAYCSGLTDVTIPSGVTNIGASAFSNCPGLTSVMFPPSVTSMGNSVFFNCTSLSSATFNGNAPLIDSGPFAVNIFGNSASGFMVYFYSGASGFTTPTWNGYPTVMLASNSEITVEHPGGSPVTNGVGSISFGSRLLGQPQVLSFTIRNDGTSALSGLATTVSGTHSADFVAGTPGSLSLSPGQATTLNVTFTPGVSGARSASLHIASNDADQNPFEIALIGTGIDTLSPVFDTAGDVPWSGTALYAGSLNFGTLTLQFAPAPGTQLRVFDNTGGNPITGTLANLAEGGMVTATYGGQTYTFTASYTGGDGNDLVFSLVSFTDVVIDFGPFVLPPVIGVMASYEDQGVTFTTNAPAGLRIYSENGSPALGMDGGDDMVISAGGGVFSLLGFDLGSPETIGSYTIVLTDSNSVEHIASSQAPGLFDENQLTNAFGGLVFRNIISARIFNEFGFGVYLDNVRIQLQTAATPPPAIWSRLLPNGDFEINFTGILQISPNLLPTAWMDVTPPPTSPHVIPKVSLGNKGFFRARGQ